jgi:hypothetical protein
MPGFALVTLVAAAAGGVPAPSPVRPADTVRFTVLIQGNRAGSQVTVEESPDTELVWFEFNDRGRGPRTETRITIGARALPTVIDISGHDYLKQPVWERFRRSTGNVTWSNDAELGESAQTDGFYVPLHAPPALSAAPTASTPFQ